MNYKEFCERCRHYQFDLNRGILCGLTGDKPAFQEVCETFEVDPKRDKARQFVFKQRQDAESLDVLLRNWGIGLILLGVVHVVFSGVLNPIWGMAIVILGLFNLFLKKPEMLIVNGISLILVGLLNLSGGLLTGTPLVFWILLGVLQLYWGYKEIKKYRFYKALYKKQNASEEAALSDTSTDTHKKHSGFGIASLVLFLCAIGIFLFNMIFAFIINLIYGEHISPDNWLIQFLNFTSLLVVFIPLIGMGLGVTGVLQRETKKISAYIGIVLNIFVFSVMAFLSYRFL